MIIKSKKITSSIVFLLTFSCAFASNDTETPRFVLALGRFHPLILHLPIGVLVFAFFLDIFGRIRKNYHEQTVKLALGFSAISAIVACVLGYFLSLEGGYSGETLDIHFYTGILTAVLTTLLYFFSGHSDKNIKRLFFPLFVLAMISISVAGHFGSILTHGDSFLTEYIKPPTQAKTIETIDELQVYDDVVFKIFDDKCIQCHNSTKTKGDLSLASTESILLGGESGQVITLGNSAESLLYKSTLLPISDEKHMPPEGKPQLSKDDIRLIKYWLDSGEDINPKVAVLPKNDTITKLLKNYLVFNKKEMKPASLEAIQDVEEAGFLVRRLAPTEPELWVKFQKGTISKKALNTLSDLKEQIIELDLKNTELTDDMLPVLKKLSNLEKLELNNTKITDKTFEYLENLTSLKVLNLVNTQVTGIGLKTLFETIKPEQVYLWNTPVNNLMASKLEADFGVAINNGTPDGFVEVTRLKAPILTTEKALFVDTLTVGLDLKLKNAKVYYTLHGKEVDSTSNLYTNPFVIDTTTHFSARIYKKGWLPSELLQKTFFKINYDVVNYAIVHQPETQYPGSGKLFDKELGSNNFKDNKWTGFLGKDINTTANLGTKKDVSTITVSCLGKVQDWILFPSEIVVYASNNKTSGFKKVGNLKINEDNQNDFAVLNTYTVAFPKIKAQYFKVVVKNPGVLPKWHEGAGNASWIFVDEIMF